MATETPTALTSYTLTVIAETGAFATVAATGHCYVIGKLVFFGASVTITTVGTAAGAVIIGLPLTTKHAVHWP